MDELRTVGLAIILAISSFVILLIGQLLIVLITSFSAFIGGEIGGGIAALILSFGFVGAMVWASTRLSLLFPVSLYNKKISIDATWEITRGRFWTLMGTYLILWLVMIVVSLIIVFTLFWPEIHALMASAGDPERLLQSQRAFIEGAYSPTTLLRSFLLSGLSIFAMIFFFAVLASATQLMLIAKEATDDPADIAPTSDEI